MKKDKFHALKYAEMIRLNNQGLSQCGYIRNPKINSNQTFVRGRCSLTGEDCQYKLPQVTTDCNEYKKMVRAQQLKGTGLEGTL